MREWLPNKYEYEKRKGRMREEFVVITQSGKRSKLCQRFWLLHVIALIFRIRNWSIH